MGAVLVQVQFVIDSAECRRRRKCRQQIVMARARLMGTGQDSIDDRQVRRIVDTLRGNAVARPNDAISPGCVLERSDHRRADRDDASASHPRCGDGGHRRFGNSIRLRQRQSFVELIVAR